MSFDFIHLLFGHLYKAMNWNALHNVKKTSLLLLSKNTSIVEAMQVF